jgi:hypothetical protein
MVRSGTWAADRVGALWQRLRGAEVSVPAVQSHRGASGEPRDDRALHDARVQALMAMQVSEVMQNNVYRREMLREGLLSARDGRAAGPQRRPARLAQRDHSDVASMETRIRALDQTIAEQAAEVGHHLAESRRLRRQAVGD